MKTKITVEQKHQRRREILEHYGWQFSESNNDEVWSEWIDFVAWLYSCMTLIQISDLIGLGKDTIRHDLLSSSHPTVSRGLRGKTGRKPIPINYEGKVYNGGLKELAKIYGIHYTTVFRRLADGTPLDKKTTR